MKEFNVYISASATVSGCVTVEADDEETARQIALDEFDDFCVDDIDIEEIYEEDIEVDEVIDE